MGVLESVERAIEERRLVPAGSTVVLGVSGGVDSVCLLSALRALQDAKGFAIQVAHLHHGARGEEADADAAFVARLARSWGLPAVIERLDVPEYARAHGLAFEEAARQARYGYLGRLAHAVGASRIAVAHNADDQAETVLMHFLRGTGLSGLRGMLPMTPLAGYRLLDQSSRARCRRDGVDHVMVIRPLLAVPRAEIERYAADEGLPFRFDRSNLDTTFFRNRLRHELLPMLKQHSPGIRERLCHTSCIIAADYELLASLVDQAWERLAAAPGGQNGVVLDRQGWQELPVSLQRATLRRAVFEMNPTLRDLGFRHTEDARRLAVNGQTGAVATLPGGLRMVVGYETLTFGTGDQPELDGGGPAMAPSACVPLDVPGCTALPGTPWALSARLLDEWSRETATGNVDPWTAYIDYEKLTPPIVLRTRRPGDVIRPLGMDGHRTKISSLMINSKIPRSRRDTLPLLVAGDRIAWVCGHRLAEWAAVLQDTRSVVRLRFRRGSLSASEQDASATMDR